MEVTLERAAELFLERLAQLEAELQQPELSADPRRAAELWRELKRHRAAAELLRRYLHLCREQRSLTQLLQSESDAELRELAREELEHTRAELEALEPEVRLALLPPDPDDQRNCIVEIRAGTGGEEAALFAADLFRIYERFAERKGWTLEVLDASPTELGGFKEIIFSLSGDNVYGTMKFESGVTVSSAFRN